MPTVIAHHDVKDVQHWLSQPTREKFFGSMGISVRTFVDPQNSQRVGLLLDVPDMDALLAALQSPEAAEAMQNDGVLPETLVMLVEKSA